MHSASVDVGSYPAGLTDTHAHLTMVAERLGAIALERVAAAYAESGAFILDPGVEYDDFTARLLALGRFPFVRLAAGIWPDADSMADIERRVGILEGHVDNPACVAVGECGLDYKWMCGTKGQQAALFTAQAELAARAGKPLIVHSREAHGDTLAIVARFASRVPVVIHCFGYDEAAARAYLAAGCWISFAGNMTYKKSEALRAALAIVPDDRLLLETDSPYMCPEPRRGKDCSPLDIDRTYELAASIRGTSVAALARLVAANARAVFGKVW